jgi:hypothetical protein
MLPRSRMCALQRSSPTDDGHVADVADDGVIILSNTTIACFAEANGVHKLIELMRNGGRILRRNPPEKFLLCDDDSSSLDLSSNTPIPNPSNKFPYQMSRMLSAGCFHEAISDTLLVNIMIGMSFVVLDIHQQDHNFGTSDFCFYSIYRTWSILLGLFGNGLVAKIFKPSMALPFYFEARQDGASIIEIY